MSQDDKPYAKPTTSEERFRQVVLMYIRDEIISPIMPPVKKTTQNGVLKSRDHTIINGLSEKHTDALLEIFKDKS